MITILSFLVILGILVFVHEFGHFIAAKSVGVTVETFSIGMGPKLVKKLWRGTEYCLSAIPLGGYVKLKGENPDETPTGASDELLAKPIPARFAIFAAGPVMNILLAILLVSLVFFIGTQVPKYIEEPPVIGWIDEGSPAEKVGLQIGDLILKIGNDPMQNWEQALLFVGATGKKPIVIEFSRNGEIQTVTIVPDVDNSIGIGDIGVGPVMKPIVGGLIAGFPAEKAGLRVGDEIVAINGARITHWIQMSKIVSVSANQELQLTVLRDGQEVQIAITPQEQDGRGLLGINSQQQTILKKYGLIESFSQGIQRCWDLTKQTFTLLRRLFTRQASMKTVGGPIMIAQMSGQVVREGLSESLNFMGFISLSLGIFNLLPIPILDGGHIFLLLVEILYRRRLHTREREIAQKIGMIILIPLFMLVFYNDITRLLGL